jgi:biotin carboxyl carrier protein
MADVVASDVVGIVRLARPAIFEGQELDEDRELAYVETLGIRNPVRSRGSGRVVAVFVTEGQPVEYGQALFAIDR